MDRAKLNDMISMEADIVSMQDLVLIDRLACKYPFCSVFWVLGARFAELTNSFNKDEWLAKAGAFTSDREHLKKEILKARAVRESKKLSRVAQKTGETKPVHDIMAEIDSYKEKELSDNPTKEEIIDRFMGIENPKPDTNETEQTDKTYNIDKVIHNSAKEDYKLVTETMAKIYVKQGKKDKAVKIYRQLMELNPQKSIYFANQIEQLKS